MEGEGQFRAMLAQLRADDLADVRRLADKACERELDRVMELAMQDPGYVQACEEQEAIKAEVVRRAGLLERARERMRAVRLSKIPADHGTTPDRDINAVVRGGRAKTSTTERFN